MKLIFLFLTMSASISSAQMNLWHGLTTNKCTITRNSCQEHLNAGCKVTKYYSVRIGTVPTKVMCEQELGGGGWLVIQRRDANTDFYKTWVNYKNGFSNDTNNFWLGLDRVNILTTTPRQLAVYLEKGTGAKAIAYYSAFQVQNEAAFYKVSSMGNYSYETSAGYSMPGNSFQVLNLKFSTWDSDHDDSSGSNCAQDYKGAWWYSACHSSNLNGLYYWSTSNTSGYHSAYANGVNWWDFYGTGTPASNDDGYHYSLKKTIMMIK